MPEFVYDMDDPAWKALEEELDKPEDKRDIINLAKCMMSVGLIDSFDLIELVDQINKSRKERL